MAENTNQSNQQKQNTEVVDGFSDAPDNAKNVPDAPDKGTPKNYDPMSPEERVRAEKEMEQDNERSRAERHGER